MCRLYGFRSAISSGAHESLVAADNALSHQSHEHPDGWGVAYYYDRYPHLIRNAKKALEDGLFNEVGALVRTRTLLAHIRQASVGNVQILNCHPFQFGPWTFGHNGEIGGYLWNPEVGERLRACVAPAFRKYVLGSTDSEVCFYVFLSHLQASGIDLVADEIPLDAVLDGLRATVARIRELADESREKTRFTIVMTNGELLVAFRFGRHMHFSTHKTHCPERDNCPLYNASRCESPASEGVVNHLIVSSEIISSTTNVWTPLQDGGYVAVDRAMNFHRGTWAECEQGPP